MSNLLLGLFALLGEQSVCSGRINLSTDDTSSSATRRRLPPQHLQCSAGLGLLLC